MAALPRVSGERAVRIFQKAGWNKDRQRGSHVILIKRGHAASLSVPQHRELAPGTLRSFPLPTWRTARSHVARREHGHAVDHRLKEPVEQTRAGLRIKCPKGGKARTFPLPAVALEALEIHRQ